jgi:hypothetical protein
MSKNSIEEIIINLEHFKTKIKKTIRFYYGTNIELTHYYEIGSSSDPCLSLSIYTQQTEIPIPDKMKKIASLSKIKKIEGCIIDFNEEIYNKYSFTKELLYFIKKYIKINYPYIEEISLTDESIIPCSIDEELDLMSYSIAFYGKTWYEINFNAKIENSSKKEAYEKAIQKYKSKELKKEFTWEHFYNIIILKHSAPYVSNMMENIYSEIENRFKNSETFPEFFGKIKPLYPENKKCIFYKTWLKRFIFTYVPEERNWLISLEQQGGEKNIELYNRMADDMKDLQNFKDLQRRFTQLANKIKDKPAEEKKKIWRVASKIVLGAFDEIYANEENGEWNLNADFFFDEEEEMKIFHGREASIDVEALKEYLDERNLSLDDGKTVVKEMIQSLDPNMTGGKRNKKRKTTIKKRKTTIKKRKTTIKKRKY